ncbi:MAG: response regulator transcription factor [Acidobacteriota bacterium]|nr:response regulator transcription factor [Acidobacteriota bacterium]
MDSTQHPINILIIDDHPTFRLGLRKLLESEADLHVVGEASDGFEGLTLARELRPHIILLDLAMRGGPGLDALADLAALDPPPRTIILTASIEKAGIGSALKLGARGIVLKESATKLIIDSIRSVAKGQYWVGQEKVSDVVQLLHRFLPQPASQGRRENFGLTAREMDVVTAVVAGYSNREIAERLSLSQETVKHHITNIFDKLGVSNRMELTLFAIGHHMTDDV